MKSVATLKQQRTSAVGLPKGLIIGWILHEGISGTLTFPFHEVLDNRQYDCFVILMILCLIMYCGCSPNRSHVLTSHQGHPGLNSEHLHL
jgi:hypothetical protein